VTDSLDGTVPEIGDGLRTSADLPMGRIRVFRRPPLSVRQRRHAARHAVHGFCQRFRAAHERCKIPPARK